MRRFLLTYVLVVLTSLFACAASKGSTIIAFLDGATSWESGGSAYGFYQLTPGSSTYVKLYATPKIDMNGGGAIYDGKFHGTSWDQTYTDTYHEYNILDWTPTANDGKKIYNYNYWASSSAYDPVEGKVYLVGLDNDTFEYTLYQVDYTTFGDGKKIKVLGDYAYAAMAFDAHGQLWAITAKGVLVKVNKTTGDETTVGNTGVKPGTSWESAAFDNKSGKLYWAAKEYTTGVSALYEVDTKTGKATPVSTFSDGEVFPLLYVEAAPDDDAPADISDLSASFDNVSLTGTVSFTVPTKTYGGSELIGNVDYTISIDGTAVKSGTAASGAKVSEKVTTTEGQHVIVVSLKANGKIGSDNKLQKWIGNDAPAAVSNPSLNIDANGKATISWTAPTTGAHNGYVGNLTYTITDKDGNVLVKNLTATNYEVQLDKSNPYAAYYYKVVAYNGVKAGEAATTPYQCFGQALTAPYASDFSTPQGAYTYEIVDNDNNGTTWGYDADTKSLIYFSMNTDYDATPDDWIVTPPFELKADRQYTFSYDARCYSESDREPLQVYMGSADVQDVKDLKTVSDIDTIHTISFKPVSKTVSVAKNGTYRFAIRTWENTGLAVFVRNITLKEGCKLAAPDSVQNLKVVHGAKGALKANVTFTAPSKTIDGKTLTSISAISIFDGNNTIASKTMSSLVPGKTYSVQVPVNARGSHTFRVIATNNEGEGLANSATAYIGQDTPLAPRNVTLVDNLDGTCKLTWKAPDTIGAHGGYVSPDSLAYAIYSVTDNTPSELKSGVKGYSYNLGTFDQENRIQKLIYYAMKAVSGDMQSGYAVSSALLSGAPYNLPVEESWKDGSQKYFWASNAVVGSNYFQWFTQVSSDDDNGCAYFGSTEAKAGDRAVLSSGKISLSGSSNPKLYFNYYLISNGAHKINVNVKTAHGVKETLTTIDFDKVYAADKTEGWKTVVLDLSKYKDEKYITVEFDATIGNPKALILLDNFRVKDVYDYDLSTSLTGPSTVKTGSKSKFTAIVTNEGLQPMSNYTVNFIVNGETVASKTISDELKASEKKTIDFDYAVPANASDSLTVKATVAHDYDMDDTNNDSKELSVRVLPATYPSVSDLKANKASAGVSLSWSSVAGRKNVITDSFEAYTPWSISGVGDWTLVDGDKNYTYGFGNKFPNQGTPYAYIVFNPSAVGDTGNNMDPHTGDQYMAAFSSSSSANNDWLISPLLSGEAQTVSFWVKTVDDSYGSEEYEVLYSTTDTATTSFQVVNAKTTAPTSWTKITVDLPAGSKYFAIHCVSNNCTMFAVDDVTYEAPAMTPVGYNIYKNGNKIASVDANTTTYTDASGETNDVYTVTAVYAEGESVFSNAASLNPAAGVEMVRTTDKGLKILYRVTDHVYIVKKDGKIFKTILKND
jgi:hypothetical protein